MTIQAIGKVNNLDNLTYISKDLAFNIFKQSNRIRVFYRKKDTNNICSRIGNFGYRKAIKNKNIHELNKPYHILNMFDLERKNYRSFIIDNILFVKCKSHFYEPVMSKLNDGSTGYKFRVTKVKEIN